MPRWPRYKCHCHCHSCSPSIGITSVLWSCFPNQLLHKMTCPLAKTYLIEYPASPQNGSPFGLVITIQPLIITPTICRHPRYGLIGVLSCSPLNPYINHQVHLHDGVYIRCTHFHQVYLLYLWCSSIFWWEYTRSTSCWSSIHRFAHICHDVFPIHHRTYPEALSHPC